MAQTRKNRICANKNLQSKSKKLRITNYELRIMHYELHITHYALRITNYTLRITHLTLFLSPNKLAGLFIGEMMFKTVNYPCVLTAANIKTVALCKGEHLLC